MSAIDPVLVGLLPVLMSRRSSRKRVDFDYSVFNRTGQKVEKFRGPNMSTPESPRTTTPEEKLRIMSLNIKSDIDDFLETYSINSLSDESNLMVYVDELKILKREHRRIHTQLSVIEGENFETAYPDYACQKKLVADAFTEANDKLSEIRKARADLEFEKLAQEKARADLELEKLREEAEYRKNSADQKLLADQERLRCELNVFKDNVEIEIEEVDLISLSASDLSEIDQLVSKFDSKLDTLDRIYFDLSGIFVGEMEPFEEVRNELYASIKSCKTLLRRRRRDITADIKLREAEQVYSNQEVLNSQKLASAHDLEAEISTRFDTLLSKIDIDVSKLGDHEILDLKKREDHYHVELREFVEKVTSYLQFVAPIRDQVTASCQRVSKMRDVCSKRITDFFASLSRAIIENDISEAKLKNATLLDIELKKFKGYNSEMDIYSFKEEFKRLVEPVIPKKLLPDYLKKNYLTGGAHTLVYQMDDIDKIWDKLISVFGNTQMLLQNKICSLDKFSSLEKTKDDEKIVFALSGLLNTMVELRRLASIYKLEGNLYYGGGLQKVLRLLGDDRKRKFLKTIAKETLNDKQKWTHLEMFLSDERAQREMYVINEKTELSLGLIQNRKGDAGKKESSKNSSQNGLKGGGTQSFPSVPQQDIICHICNDSKNHVLTSDKDGKNVRIEYFACEKFVNADAHERAKLLKVKEFCKKCLKPGVKRGPGHDCDQTFLCKNTFKGQTDRKCQHHVLVCGFHNKEKSNMELFKQYKSKFVDNSHVKYESFTKKLAISFHVDPVPVAGSKDVNSSDMERPVRKSAFFMFQRWQINGEIFNIFYDDGCFDACFRKSAIERLKKMNRAVQSEEGPMIITGVTGAKTICPEGEYTITVPLANGGEAKMSGLCLERVTGRFSEYSPKAVESQFHGDIQVLNSNHDGDLPQLPDEVGGEVDIMIGTLYRKYQPIEVIRLESGLSLLRSAFLSPDMTDGVIAGPCPESHNSDRTSHFVDRGDLIDPAVEAYTQSLILQNSVPLLGNKCDIFHCNRDTFEGTDVCLKRKPNKVKVFEDIENSGTEINFRCLNCRNCAECRKGPLIENLSIQEEIEQHMIEKSVTVDPEKRESVATLPFLSDPDKALSPNYNIARKVYDGQTKKLSKRQDDKMQVIDSERKLQDLGYVDFLDNLSEERRKSILESAIRYFIPWRVVWNEKSVTTAVRLVFDASQKTSSGVSLNDLLAKGAKVINSLIQILIRWKTKRYAFHTDITKMYNAVKLHEDFWRYQLYLWEQDLDPDKEPVLKVIKTLIYGVVPSGNQAIAALRRIADRISGEFPLVSKILKNDLYVDDCISGADTLKELDEVTDGLKIGVEKGGFSLKGFTFSGSLPDEKLTSDGVSILVGGYRWFPEIDKVSLGMDELNFSKRVRGRKEDSKGVPLDLCKRDCAGKVAECFSPSGIFVPLLSGMKYDISYLHAIGLDWDDRLPDNLRGVWESHFEMLNEMRSVRFNRAIVPVDAKSLDIEILGFGDASEKLICAAIYGRFERKDGTFSCQLLFARSKVISDISIPRAELLAALLNASTGHVVERALGDMHKSTLKFTDSQVAFHWICSTRSILKPWVRNRVVEIVRLCPSIYWRFVDSLNMVADIGTRRGVKLSDVIEGSNWMNGFPWMSDLKENFPVSTIEQVKLDNAGLQSLQKEQIDINPQNLNTSKTSSAHTVNYAGPKVKERYEFSQYILDPNKFRFRKSVRITSLVMTFIWNISINVERVRKSKLFTHSYPGTIPKGLESTGNKYIVSSCGVTKIPKVGVIEVLDAMIQAAFYYYIRKATAELKQFIDRNLYSKISMEIDDVLYFSGRIPPDTVEGELELWDVALDLSKTTFCVPVMDRLSPVAFAIAMETHWFHPDTKHNKGVETLLRATGKYAYIIGGRSLVKMIKHNCKLCRILYKKTVEAVMGPLQTVNLCIAPCFYACQADIFGPRKSFSYVNKRATVKVWFVVFVCCTTGAVDIRLMEDYTTDSFVLAFIRFSCRFGYPKWVLPDEGSQLVKGCKDMEYSFIDAQHRLSLEYGVEYTACPVGAHYVHGKVERKIQHVKKSLDICTRNERLSTIQWESLMQQIANSVNNAPIGVKNKVENLENLDILTPNRLLLGRNNNRCPNSPVEITNDYRRIIETNANIFKAWFNAWLTSHVPTIVERPKWHTSDPKVKVGDVILFLKSEQQFDIQYQYGIVSSVFEGRDGHVRDVEIEYRNHNEDIRRKTRRGVRDIVMIHPIDELDLYHELSEMMI